MKRLWLLSVATISLVLMAAQEAEPPGFQQWTPVSLKPYEQRMHDDAAADPHLTGKRTVRPSGMKLRPTFSSYNPVRQR